MSNPDPRIDVYINKAAPFAQPILRHIRRLVHKACPEVEENLKGGIPYFDYKGTIVSLAAFKSHCILNIWKGRLIKGLENIGEADDMTGQFGQIISIDDLPDGETLLGYFREAKRLNDENIKVPQKSKEQAVKELIVPECLLEALKENPLAAEFWDKFAYSQRKEYVNWITEAKNDAARNKRLAKAIEMLVEGNTQPLR